MSIVAQALELAYRKLKENPINLNIEEYLSPLYWKPSSLNYGRLIQEIDQNIKLLARNSLIELLEDMDREFRYSDTRIKNYYVKNTRDRTIMTIFGPITYKRTEYIDRHTNKSFIYIDRKIGLDKRIRYDPVVSSLAYEMYSNHNSMIKVGQNLGSLIYGYSLNRCKDKEAIPRQTIWRMVNRFKEIIPKIKKANNTPKTLYIMADEKYIPLQGKDKPSKKLMNKIAVSFEGIDTSNNKRHRLSNPRYFYYQDKDFWERLYDNISEIYDLDKIDNIYILGDGASWIKSGTSEFGGGNNNFGLCKFHLSQAINHITDNQAYKNLILDYSIHNDKKGLESIFNSILEANPSREDILKQKMSYILNNLYGIHNMYTKIKVGCPMEQAIQHVLQSPFTSVPKAYSHKNLPTYINSRINHMNNYDLRVLYLSALDTDDNINTSITLDTTNLDFSWFNPDQDQHTYHLNLPASVVRKYE